jgi:hypothetical protein
MERFIDLFEEQVVEGDLSMDEFADQIAEKFGDLFEYADPNLFEARLHRFIANMYRGRAIRKESDTPFQEEE